MSYGAFACEHCGDEYPFDWMRDIHQQRCAKRQMRVPPRMLTPDEELFHEFMGLVMSGRGAPDTEGDAG